jgi:hypothetical protein
MSCCYGVGVQSFRMPLKVTRIKGEAGENLFYLF